MINGQLLGIVPGLGFQPQKKKKNERKNFPLRTTKPEGKVGVWDYSELVRTERRKIHQESKGQK